MLGIPLSERQLDVLELVADGHDCAEIARRLGVPRGAIEGQLRQVLHRLGVRTRPALVVRRISALPLLAVLWAVAWPAFFHAHGPASRAVPFAHEARAAQDGSLPSD